MEENTEFANKYKNKENEIIHKLIEEIEEKKLDQDMILYAMDYAKKYHKGQIRKSGEPFYYHAIEVTIILMSFVSDHDTIIASMLHDGVEDTKLFLPQIGLIFGSRVQYLVDRLTKLDNDVKKLSLSDYEKIDKLTILKDEDKNVAYIKLADRTHNMRTISYLSSLAKRQRISRETITQYVPLARYLELKEIETELKTLALEILNI